MKFCGITRADDVRLAGELGVDAIGLIFAARSPRRVDIDHALSLREAAAAMTSVVALVMDNPAAEVEAIVQRLRPQLLQFHGIEDDASCARHGVPFLKAIAMRDVAADDVPALLARYSSATGFVFDGHAPGAMGGSGERFDWTRLAQHKIARPWLLAGGLDAANVGAAVREMRPWGVDVSSGIESHPGIKDGAKMRAFVDAVRHADNDLSGWIREK
ncbi:MAG TPA: phosphoribosylanthranilate isomerase [Xanthomonadaceae bacterium]|nr:phosphoribosylanthranilate isomerase [Xanthomonadaceae bacterium]